MFLKAQSISEAQGDFWPSSHLGDAPGGGGGGWAEKPHMEGAPRGHRDRSSPGALPPPAQSHPPPQAGGWQHPPPHQSPSWQELCLHPRNPNLAQHNQPPEGKRSTGSPHASFSETPRSHSEAHHPPGSHEAQAGLNPLVFPSAPPRAGSLRVVASQAHEVQGSRQAKGQTRGLGPALGPRMPSSGSQSS